MRIFTLRNVITPISNQRLLQRGGAYSAKGVSSDSFRWGPMILNLERRNCLLLPVNQSNSLIIYPYNGISLFVSSPRSVYSMPLVIIGPVVLFFLVCVCACVCLAWKTLSKMIKSEDTVLHSLAASVRRRSVGAGKSGRHACPPKRLCRV